MHVSSFRLEGRRTDSWDMGFASATYILLGATSSYPHIIYIHMLPTDYRHAPPIVSNHRVMMWYQNCLNVVFEVLRWMFFAATPLAAVHRALATWDPLPFLPVLPLPLLPAVAIPHLLSLSLPPPAHPSEPLAHPTSSSSN